MISFPLRPLSTRRTLRAGLLLSAVLASFVNGFAQNYAATGSAADATATSPGRKSQASGGTAAQADAHPPLFRWGPLGLRPQVQYSVIYADRLQRVGDRSASTYIQTATAGARLDLGDNWHADYAASWVSYSQAGFRDTLDHSLSLDGRLVRPEWFATITERYIKTDSPMAETARQTGQQMSATEGGVTWRIGHDFTFHLQGEQKLTFLKSLSDTYEWSLLPEVGYHVSRHITVGLGVTEGYVLVYHASDMMYTRPVARFLWDTSSKTSVNLEAGYDRWRFIAKDGQSISGLFLRGTVTYAIFEPTSLVLGVQKTDSAAPFRNQASKIEDVSLTLRQRLLKHLHLELGAEQQKTAYVVNTPGLEVARSDTVYSYKSKLSIQFLRERASAAIFYRYSKNSSSEPGVRISSNQMGFEISFKY